MPSVRQRLSCSLGRRDELPNVELAEAIVQLRDRAAIVDLVALLGERSKAIRGDALKALYEVAARAPALVAPHWQALADLLGSNVQRLVWGAMIGLDHVTALEPKGVASCLPAILAAAAGKSVIARDHAVGILAQLALLPAYRRRAAAPLLAILRRCPDLQFPMYCERSLDAALVVGKAPFVAVMTARLPKLPRESQRRRVAKVLARLGPPSKRKLRAQR